MPEVPEWVGDIVSRLQPHLPEGVVIAVEHPSEGLYELVGRDSEDHDVCLVCGEWVSGVTVEILPHCGTGPNRSVGPNSEIVTPIVCRACGEHMAGGRGPRA